MFHGSHLIAEGSPTRLEAGETPPQRLPFPSPVTTLSPASSSGHTVGMDKAQFSV